MIIFSGIQPTGRKHLGNYIGAISQYVAGQDEGDPAIYCIVDLHAVSVDYNPTDLRSYLYDTTALLLASGLDPQRCILFRQSDVAAHAELSWLLGAVTPVGELNRMHQFRDKSAAQRQLVSSALLLYPVLQAADVLAYKTDVVPVGEDQREHLELMRDIANRFNTRFGDILTIPAHRVPEVGARIRDLQNPDSKMSTTAKSDAGTVFLLEDEQSTLKKFKRAVTDSDSRIFCSADKPGITNLIHIFSSVTNRSTAETEIQFDGARYGDFKTAVGEAVNDFLRPIRQRYETLREDEERLELILEVGADKAEAIANNTLAEVREAMGMGRSQA